MTKFEVLLQHEQLNINMPCTVQQRLPLFKSEIDVFLILKQIYIGEGVARINKRDRNVYRKKKNKCCAGK